MSVHHFFSKSSYKSFFVRKSFLRRQFWWATGDDVKSSISVIKPGPKEHYLDLTNRKVITYDSAQYDAVTELDNLYRCINDSNKKSPTCKGVYLYGGVGRGKTMMMDMFYTTLDSHKKLRIHFHSWMLDVHKLLHKNRGSGDALAIVASELAKRATILCLDELEITDVADAFVVRWLFDRLWMKHGVIVVFTSNSSPDNLYFGGINRSSFIPFVTQLKSKTVIVSLDLKEKTDYRKLVVPLIGKMYCCNFEDFEQSWQMMLNLEQRDTSLKRQTAVSIGENRAIIVPVSRGRICRFSFAELCGSATGAADYLALTDRFSCIALEGVPLLGGSRGDDEARRFITLVDVMYERHGLLLIQADALPSFLFTWNEDENQDVYEDHLHHASDMVLNRRMTAIDSEIDMSDEVTFHPSTERCIDGDDIDEHNLPVENTSTSSMFRERQGEIQVDIEEDDLQVLEQGGSSGRVTTMIKERGHYIEWSGTGRVGIGMTSQSSSSFTEKAAARTISRLVEMSGGKWLEEWTLKNS